MEYLCLISKENTTAAENALRADFDIASKQSITIKDAKLLGIDLEGSIFFIRGSDEGVEKCKELLSEFVMDSDQSKLEEGKQKILDEENAAAEGMGGIFG